MTNKDRTLYESPEMAGGEFWLYSEQQHKLCHFKPDTATVHAQWVAIRTYSCVLPRPPEPMTCRRMLRHNAIEAGDKMPKSAGCVAWHEFGNRSCFFAKTDGPSSLPLTWVRVPAGALQNGTHSKYASNTSRFSVN